MPGCDQSDKAVSIFAQLHSFQSVPLYGGCLLFFPLFAIFSIVTQQPCAHLATMSPYFVSFDGTCHLLCTLLTESASRFVMSLSTRKCAKIDTAMERRRRRRDERRRDRNDFGDFGDSCDVLVQPVADTAVSQLSAKVPRPASCTLLLLSKKGSVSACLTTSFDDVVAGKLLQDRACLHFLLCDWWKVAARLHPHRAPPCKPPFPFYRHRQTRTRYLDSLCSILLPACTP